MIRIFIDISLRVIFNIPNVRDVAGELVEAYLVDEVSAHGVQEIGVLVNDVLVVEEELVRLKQLLLLHHQLVRILVVLHYLVVFHVVVRNGLASKHDECILVNHVQTNQPDPPIHDGVQDHPRVPLNVQLLDAGSVSTCLVAHSVDVPLPVRAAVWPSDCLLQAWQGLLLHGVDSKLLALLEVLALERSANDVHDLLELGYSEVNSIVHHLSKRFKRLGWDVE